MGWELGWREGGRNEVLQEEDELHINSKQTSIPLVIVSHTHTYTRLTSLPAVYTWQSGWRQEDSMRAWMRTPSLSNWLHSLPRGAPAAIPK